MPRFTDKQVCIILVIILIIGWAVSMLIKSLSPSRDLPDTVGKLDPEYTDIQFQTHFVKKSV